MFASPSLCASPLVKSAPVLQVQCIVLTHHKTPFSLSKQATMPLSPSYSQVLQSCPGLTGHLPPPPVPLELLEARALKKSEYLKMDLKSNPGKAMSEMYSINVPYFSHGLPYKWTHFLKTFEEVVKGQNLMSATSKFTMMRMLPQGNTLDMFKSKATGLLETQANFIVCKNAVTHHVFPHCALL